MYIRIFALTEVLEKNCKTSELTIMHSRTGLLYLNILIVTVTNWMQLPSDFCLSKI